MADHTVHAMSKWLKIHPRTILRRLYPDDPNPYWVPHFDKKIKCSEEEICKAFGMSAYVLSTVVNGEDWLYNQVDTAKKMKIPLRTFRHRKYPRAIDRPGLVRYAMRPVNAYHRYHFH